MEKIKMTFLFLSLLNGIFWIVVSFFLAIFIFSEEDMKSPDILIAAKWVFKNTFAAIVSFIILPVVATAILWWDKRKKQKTSIIVE